MGSGSLTIIPAQVFLHPPSDETETRSRRQKLFMGTDRTASFCNPKPVIHERPQMAVRHPRGR